MNKFVAALLVAGVSAQGDGESHWEKENDETIYCGQSQECVGPEYANGCCASLWAVDGNADALDQMTRNMMGKQVCVPSHAVDIMDQRGGQSNLFEFHQQAFDNYPQAREAWLREGDRRPENFESLFNQISKENPGMENWRNFTFGAKCVDQRLKGGVFPLDKCWSSDDCSKNKMYEGGCCGSLNFDAAMVPMLDMESRKIFERMESGQSYCWPKASADAADAMGGKGDFYSFQKSVFENDKWSREMWTKDMNPRPESFDEWYNQVMPMQPEIASWQQFQIDGQCIDGRVEGDWDEDEDRRKGRGGDRMGNMMEMMEGDGIMMSMGGTKIMIKMGAIRVAAPVAAVLGAMTLW